MSLTEVNITGTLLINYIMKSYLFGHKSWFEDYFLCFSLPPKFFFFYLETRISLCSYTLQLSCTFFTYVRTNRLKNIFEDYITCDERMTLTEIKIVDTFLINYAMKLHLFSHKIWFGEWWLDSGVNVVNTWLTEREMRRQRRYATLQASIPVT